MKKSQTSREGVFSQIGSVRLQAGAQEKRLLILKDEKRGIALMGQAISPFFSGLKPLYYYLREKSRGVMEVKGHTIRF